MAKYTETLGEYLEAGHSLPSIFSQITDFDKYFLARYIDREIGFETETLFEIKLEGKADLVIPLYKDRILALNTAIMALSTPNKKTTVDKSGYYTHNTDVTESGTDSVVKDYDEGGKDTVEKDYGEGGTESLQHGAQSGSRTQLPFNAATSAPNEKTETTQYTDETTFGKTIDDTTDTTYGKTIDDTTETTYGHTYDTDLRHDDYLKEETSVTGFSTEENLARIGLLQGELVNMIDRCLNEFKHLFMQIYT